MKYKNRIKKIETKMGEDSDKLPRKLEDWLSYDDQKHSVKEYDNLSGWEVSVSSTGAMIAELEQAIENEEEIVVTGWQPHWMFMDYDLKMLEDPKNVFGGHEEIRSYAREGFQEDNPEAYKIIDNFYWEVADMSAVMEELATGVEPEEAADNWIEANREIVDGWLE